MELTEWVANINTCVNSRWNLHIGDPTTIGWIVSGGYALAALSCVAAGLESASEKPKSQYEFRIRAFWILAAVLLTFLAFNKQMDLQSLLTATGRCIAIDMGVFEYRRGIQATFFIGFATVAISILFAGIVYFRAAVVLNAWASVGLMLLLFFVLFRAAVSTHLIEAENLPAAVPPGLTVVELIGAGMILLSSWRR